MVAIGTMTNEDRRKMIAEIRAVALKYFNDPSLLHCYKCTNKRKPRSYFCGVHDSAANIHCAIVEDLCLLLWSHRRVRARIQKIDSADKDLPEIEETLRLIRRIGPELKIQ